MTCDAFLQIADKLEKWRSDTSTSPSPSYNVTLHKITQSDALTALPSLRRYSKGLVGSDLGDDVLLRALSPLIQSPRLPGTSPFLALFHFVRKRIDEEHQRRDSIEKLSHPEQILQQLPLRERQAFLLVNVERMSDADAAELLDTSTDETQALIERAGRSISALLSAKILIIEDKIFIAADLEGLVENLGHTVVGVASTASQAIELAKNDPPELILADIQLRDGSSGIDATRSIGAANPTILIFITAYPERFLTSLRPEPAFLIAKPFQPNTVASIISQTLFFARRAKFPKGKRSPKRRRNKL